MNIFRNRSNWQVFLFLFAILIGVGSLVYTQFLVRDLKAEERKKVEMWAAAIRLINSADSTQNLDFPFSIIENNKTVPVILTDGHDNIIAAENIEQAKLANPGFMALELEKIKREDCRLLDELMTEYSKILHDQAEEARVPLPVPEKLRGDIKKLSEWVTEYNKR